MNSIQQVLEFHKFFGHPVNNQPFITEKGLCDLRVNLIAEENTELKIALLREDPEEVFDALLDLQYILDGAFVALGFYLVKDAGFDEVHRANMRKVGPDGKPRYRADGKILKPAGWTPPNLKGVLSML